MSSHDDDTPSYLKPEKLFANEDELLKQLQEEEPLVEEEDYSASLWGYSLVDRAPKLQSDDQLKKQFLEWKYEADSNGVAQAQYHKCGSL
jgi:hypothetical protein